MSSPTSLVRQRRHSFPGRTLTKHTHHPSILRRHDDWLEKFRRSCFENVAQERHKWLERLRGTDQFMDTSEEEEDVPMAEREEVSRKFGYRDQCLC
jgi:hypothetical protein